MMLQCCLHAQVYEKFKFTYRVLVTFPVSYAVSVFQTIVRFSTDGFLLHGCRLKLCRFSFQIMKFTLHTLLI